MAATLGRDCIFPDLVWTFVIQNEFLSIEMLLKGHVRGHPLIIKAFIDHF